MAIDDLDLLRQEMPDAFLDLPTPPDWTEDWQCIPIDDADTSSLDEGLTADSQRAESTVALQPNLGVYSPVPDFGPPGAFAGAPQQWTPGGPPPPPDAFAFYLPFHYFHPEWWGVYLLLEPMHELARYFSDRSNGALEFGSAFVVARLFLYGHEAFHHAVEAFGARLEVTHRVPIYRSGLQALFRRTLGTDSCAEEALATAAGYRKVELLAFRKPDEPPKREAALRVLREYIAHCPPGYRRAADLLRPRLFTEARAKFAEDNQRESLPALPHKGSAIWRTFPHAFSGISRVTSRVNYVVRRGSPLGDRLKLSLRYFRYREVTERLSRVAGSRRLRQGHGSHEIWLARTGRRFTVPHHTGDLGIGLIAKIIKDAGVSQSVAEFMKS